MACRQAQLRTVACHDCQPSLPLFSIYVLAKQKKKNAKKQKLKKKRKEEKMLGLGKKKNRGKLGLVLWKKKNKRTKSIVSLSLLFEKKRENEVVRVKRD